MVQGSEQPEFQGVQDEAFYYDSIEGLVSVGAAGKALDDLFVPETEPSLPSLISEEVDEASTLYEAGLLLNFKKEGQQALGKFQQAYALFLQQEDVLGALRCLIELGWIQYEQDPKDGITKCELLFTEAIKMINVHLDYPGINEVRARLLHYQGLVKYREKSYGEAVRHFMYARTLCANSSLESARILDSLAVHYEHTNDYYRAIQCLGTSLRIKKQLNCNYEQAITCQLKGRIYILREEYERASEFLNEALQIASALDDVYRCARIQNDLIRLSIYQGDISKANTLIAAIELEYRDKRFRISYGKALFYKAYIQYSQLEFDSAHTLLDQEVLPIFERYGNRKGFAMAKRLLACIHYQQGAASEALEEISAVIAIFKEEGIISELAKTYYELAKIYLSLNEPKLALASLMESLRIAESNGLSFIISHIEDEIFRLDERTWQQIVEKRANHDRVFEKESNLLEALSALGEVEIEPDEAPAEQNQNPNQRLVSLLRIGQALAAERDLDKLLQLIKDETEQALNADRCTVFLYDRKENELWSKVATGLDTSEEIRFPAHLGLAGYVAKTGETLNIKDAYEDPRFNSDIDKKTGYVTRNILCMPMRNRQLEIIGVFQVLNKKNDSFDKVDEDLLTAISTNAGVAIENATLTKEMKISFDSFVKTLSSTIDARDPITAGHSERVAEYSVLLGEEMELHQPDLEALKYASLLHDIGKIGIREDVLKKDGRLTEKEYRHIQKHVYYTHEILKNVHFERHLQLVPEIAASHHEKIDGSGYHRGLKGEEILLSGRILAISDVFDAITSRRHYRNRMAFDKVLTILKRDAGTHFDAECVSHFFNIPLQKIGHVLLMEGEKGIHTLGLKQMEQLDPSITIQEYYQILGKPVQSAGEAEIHQLFSTIYQQPLGNTGKSIDV